MKYQIGDQVYHETFKIGEIVAKSTDKWDISFFENRIIKNIPNDQIRKLTLKEFFLYKSHNGSLKIGNNTFFEIFLRILLFLAGSILFFYFAIIDEGSISRLSWSVIGSVCLLAIGAILLSIRSNWKTYYKRGLN